MGSTGSRLLTGNSDEMEMLEKRIAEFHKAPAALLFNSGYAANEGLISTLCRKGDVILFDAYVHASIRQGISLSSADDFSVAHNDVHHLRSLLEQHPNKTVFVVVESVYSMDGDHAPLQAIVNLKSEFSFELIVDEAHALGVFGEQGRGRCDDGEIYKECTARIYTFGKALGGHGAVVIGSNLLKDYLVNYCKSLIYTTAPDHHFYVTVEHSYNFLLRFDNQRIRLNNLIEKFKLMFSNLNNYEITGSGPVFSLICGSAERTRRVAQHLQNDDFDLRPIVYPTVPKGSERIRISLHSFNTETDLEKLLESIQKSAS